MSAEQWYPDINHWVGAVVVAIAALIIAILGQLVTTKISFDILENCQPHGIKESSKNLWTNVGLTSALLVTMVMAMLQVDPIAANGFDLDPTDRMHLQQFYVSLCIASLLWNLICIVTCVINLSYVDPLSDIDAIAFFLNNADAIGDPAVFLGESCIFFMFAILVWVLGTYGIAQGVLMGSAMLTFIIVALGTWRKRSLFQSGIDVSWTQDSSKWTLENNCTPGLIAKKGDKQVVGIVKKLGQIVLEEQLKKDDTAESTTM